MPPNLLRRKSAAENTINQQHQIANKDVFNLDFKLAKGGA